MNDQQTCSDATLALGMLLVDPPGLGGIVLIGRPGYLRDRWLKTFKSLLDENTPIRRLPVSIDEDRLLGGLDIVATLTTMRPVVARGLLAECHQGVVILPMAERIRRGIVAQICATLDNKQVSCQRDGISKQWPAEICVVALDEHAEDEHGISPDLEDRLALSISMDDPDSTPVSEIPWSAKAISEAKNLLPGVTVSDSNLDQILHSCAALGIDSMRIIWLAFKAARTIAALDGRMELEPNDLEAAVRLVLLPRARQWPMEANEEDQEPERAEDPPPPEPDNDESQPASDEPEIPDEILLQAALASLPPDLLNKFSANSRRRRNAKGGGRFGAGGAGRKRGRPLGARRGAPGNGNRLNILATLKAAVPWQGIRKPENKQRPGHDKTYSSEPRVRVFPDDLHVTHYKVKHESTVIFLVDASGSAATQRLAESKGAVELLLSQCYVRRDQVALLAFRGKGADILLPPTRAMARARRELAALPGGGGTPMAAGFKATAGLAEDVERRGRRPVIVIMTDGRANIAADGSPGHTQATADAENTARFMREKKWDTLFIDTSRRPKQKARDIAEALGAEYMTMPHANAHKLNDAIKGSILS